MAVRVWLRAGESRQLVGNNAATYAGNVELRLRPLNGCAPPAVTEVISAVSQDHNTCRAWIADTATIVNFALQIRRGRHVRARTLENARDDLEQSTHDLGHLMDTPRWRASRALHSPARPMEPIPASLELVASVAVHFLCLLRCRVAGGAITADLWRAIVTHVLPCVKSFGYAKTGPMAPWIVLEPLPELPGTWMHGWGRPDQHPVKRI